MASGDLYEVERIVDKRRNKKGKWEYLIRWKGYGSTEDTWEPEHHLLHCEEFIDEFNGLHLAKDKRLKSGKQASTSKVLRDSRGPSVEKLSHRPSESSKSKGTSHKRKRITPSLTKPKKGYSAKPPAGGDRAAKTVSYRTTPSGLQIMPLKKAQNGMENGDAGSEKDERHLGNGSHQPGLDVNDAGEQDLGDCDVSPAALAENGLGSALTNGGLNLHSPVKRKLETEKDYVFDKRLRYSVRQNESNCRFRDIVVRKEEGFTHILLSSQTSDNNALTPEIMKEVRRALCNAATDDSKLLLLSAVGSVFCSGLDYSYLIGRLSSDRRKESTRIAEAIRFVKTAGASLPDRAVAGPVPWEEPTCCCTLRGPRTRHGSVMLPGFLRRNMQPRGASSYGLGIFWGLTAWWQCHLEASPHRGCETSWGLRVSRGDAETPAHVGSRDRLQGKQAQSLCPKTAVTSCGRVLACRDGESPKAGLRTGVMVSHGSQAPWVQIGQPSLVHGRLFSALTQLCLFAAALSHSGGSSGVSSRRPCSFMGPSEVA
uniref:Chromodomain Y like 2 n=2 Tax=Sus scrofa TaxID=9823 RepID=A0A8D0SX75_PIG